MMFTTEASQSGYSAHNLGTIRIRGRECRNGYMNEFLQAAATMC